MNVYYDIKNYFIVAELTPTGRWYIEIKNEKKTLMVEMQWKTRRKRYDNIKTKRKNRIAIFFWGEYKTTKKEVIETIEEKQFFSEDVIEVVIEGDIQECQ